MAIRWAEDLGAPALVAAADIATSELKPEWNRPLGISLAAAGYILSGLLGIGGTFVKNVGIASFPWAIGSIYQYIKESAAVTGRASSRTGTRIPLQSRSTASQLGSRIGRYPAQETKEEFEDVRLIG